MPESNSKWTLDTLYAHVNALSELRESKYQQRFEAQQLAVANIEKLNAQYEALNLAAREDRHKTRGDLGALINILQLDLKDLEFELHKQLADVNSKVSTLRAGRELYVKRDELAQVNGSLSALHMVKDLYVKHEELEAAVNVINEKISVLNHELTSYIDTETGNMRATTQVGA